MNKNCGMYNKGLAGVWVGAVNFIRRFFFNFEARHMSCFNY